MRSAERTSTLNREVALVCLADAVVGASFGAIAVAGGLPVWVPVTMSLLVFAGGAQFSAVGVVLAGGGPVAAVTTGLLLNTRHLPFGFAVADVLGPRPLTTVVGAHLMVDESVAFCLGQSGSQMRRRAFWTSGLALFGAWNVAVLIGALAGQVIGDTDAFGLDAAFPAVLLALVLPALRDGRTRTAALLGAIIALVATPVLPAGLPVLTSLLGLLALRWRP
jgi:4-azaleucine resistance transporter AzlC